MKLNVLKAFAVFSGDPGRSSNLLLRAALLAFAAALAPFAADSAHAEDKIALVIGNSQYRYVPALTNPANDATDMAASLQRLGFKVKHFSDLDYNAFRRALIEFGSEAKTADKAVIFYAGHGVEIDGKNWLIPVDAEVKSEIDVYAEGINLETLIDLSVLPKVVGLIVLDACRNNPFASATGEGRSLNGPNPPASNGTPAQAAPSPAPADDATPSLAAPRGLAPVDVTDNVLVAFSAAAGTTANDGAGRNSPYSGALLKYVEKPGLEINYLFRDVHDDVLKATLNTQEPAVYGTLSKDEIFLKDGEAPLASTDDKGDAEKLAWSFVRSTNDIGVLRRFSAQFPASPHHAEVVARIAQLEDSEKFAWQMVEHQPSASSYKAFLDLYPFGDHADKARATLASLTSSSPPTSAVDTQALNLPEVPAASYQLAAASPETMDKPDETSNAIETAWDVLKGSKDENVAGRFAEKFPSLRHHRLPPGSDFALRPVNPTEWMLKTAGDEEVNSCFGGDSAACVKAIEKYPDYVQLRFQLCRTTGRPEDQADRQKGHSDDCMQDAVDDARARGFLVSAFTRSKEEIARDQQYRVAVQQVQQHIGNVVSDTVNNVVSNIVSGAASNAAATAAARAASTAGNIGVIPAFTPILVPPPTPRWESRLSSVRSGIAVHNLNRAGLTPSPMVHSISPSIGTNAATKASNAVPGAISRATTNAISKATTNAASKAASNAASHAASKAAFNAANRAVSTAVSNAASRSASHAASRAAANAAANAASRAAAHAASRAASNAASNAAGHIAIPSDIRLKQDIVPLVRSADGLQLYRYRYIGDDVFYVGVMAQEVAERQPAAVTRGEDGYLRVDYGRLGLTFMTFEEWTRRNAQSKAGDRIKGRD